jgi:hypothetical protein
VSQSAIAPPETPRRRFRLTDAMILTAGVSIWLSQGVHLFESFASPLSLFHPQVAHHGPDTWHWPWFAGYDQKRYTLWYYIQFASAFLSGLTPAYVLLRLTPPRPPLRAVLRQPGMVAGLAVIFGLFWGTGWLLMLFPKFVNSMTAAPIAVGGSVALAWLILGLSRQCQSEAGWIDRLGRSLGVIALGSGLLGLMLYWI